MLNRIMLQGRFVKDGELRRTQSGLAVTTFTLAVERDFKDKQTGKREADFINCVAYSSTGEHIARFFQKGSMAIIEGRLQIRNYIGKDGNKKYVTEVIVNSIYFGESKKSQQSNSENSEEQTFEELPDDGELPF